jgi:hypothetical protein
MLTWTGRLRLKADTTPLKLEARKQTLVVRLQIWFPLPDLLPSLRRGEMSTSTELDAPDARFNQIERGTVIDLPQRP